MSVSVGLHRWDQFPEKNGLGGWRMAKLRKMEWLALAGLALSAVQWRGPCIQAAQTRIKPRQKYGAASRNRPRLGVHQVGEGLRPAGSVAAMLAKGRWVFSAKIINFS